MVTLKTVDLGQAENQLSEWIALAEGGEHVVIARAGVPVARLARVRHPDSAKRFLDAKGSLAGQIRIGDDFEFSDAEPDEMFTDPSGESPNAP